MLMLTFESTVWKSAEAPLVHKVTGLPLQGSMESPANVKSPMTTSFFVSEKGEPLLFAYGGQL